MSRWVYVRTILDKYRGTSFHLLVTAAAAGSVPGREIANREELISVLRRAELEKLMAGIDDAQARGEVFCSGPVEISQEQEDRLLGRG